MLNNDELAELNCIEKGFRMHSDRALARYILKMHEEIKQLKNDLPEVYKLLKFIDGLGKESEND